MLQNATAQFNRDQKLFDAKIEPQDQFDASKANWIRSVRRCNWDELNLGFCEIRALFDAVAGALQFYQGNVVKAPDDTLVTLNQIHPTSHVQFGVPEQFLPEIRRLNAKTPAESFRVV